MLKETPLYNHHIFRVKQHCICVRVQNKQKSVAMFCFFLFLRTLARTERDTYFRAEKYMERNDRTLEERELDIFCK